MKFNLLILVLLLFPNYNSYAACLSSCIEMPCGIKSLNQNVEKKEKEEKKEEHPPKIGNFSLPVSQQPFSLVSFGGNIFDKGTIQFTTSPSYFRGVGQYSTTLDSDLVYSFSDTSSIMLDVPYEIRNKIGEHHSSGIEDIFLQLETQFYSKNNLCYEEVATMLGAIYFPTGNPSKNPPTGAGAPSYFLGLVYDRSYVDWYYFTCQGVFLPTSHHGNKNGNVYLYQFGLGYNIDYVKDLWIFDFILELTGQYTNKEIDFDVPDPDSGGNVVLLTPSLWFSTKKLTFQFGVSYPIVQHLFGAQAKEHYGLLASFSYTF